MIKTNILVYRDKEPKTPRKLLKFSKNYYFSEIMKKDIQLNKEHPPVVRTKRIKIRYIILEKFTLIHKQLSFDLPRYRNILNLD